MAIENWMDLDHVEDPRRHTLGGFRPGRGFGPSDVEDDDTLTAPIEVDKDDLGEDTVPMVAPVAKS